MSDNYLKDLFINEAKPALQRHSGGGGAPDTRLKDLVEGTLTELVDDTITKIGTYAFYQNKNITKVELPNCTTAGSSAFTYSGITEVNLPLLTSGGDFTNCSELTRAVLGSIKSPKFKLCKKLVYCDLGTEVTSLPTDAFSNTFALETLIIRNPSTVPTLGSNSFVYSGVQDIGYIYVPDNMVESYKTEWSGLADRIKPLSELAE